MEPFHGHGNETQMTEKTFEQSDAAELPNRYSIRSSGEERALLCAESPTITVRIERSMTIAAGAALKAPSGTIYLDGAAQGGPFLNSERDLLNLDHHEGCLRAFTVATCEQAMIVIRKGLDLQRRDWTIWANEPDLDTVLAIWILLNHMRLNDVDPEIRGRLMPLVRLEGTIDAHGLEMQELCGFPPEMQASVFGDLERLRAREAELKKEGKWQEIDFLEYTADVLRAIDSMIYSSRHFEGVVDVEELARAVIGEKQLAIVCRSDMGIYELEPHLRRLHGKRLGVIILQKDPSTYTLRQVDTFLPGSLDRAYERLNLIDPSAGGRRSGNRWGGSGEIGGSPRSTGTALTPQQIAQAFAQAYRRPTTAQRLGTVAIAALLTVGVMGGSIMVTYILGWLQNPGGSIESYFQNRGKIFLGVFAAINGALVLVAFRRGPKFFGLRIPTEFDWLLLLPGALLGGLAGGAWSLVGSLGWSQPFAHPPWIEFTMAMGPPVAAEVLFRGLVHGILAQRFSTQHAGGHWFLSWPVLISSVLYGLWSLPPLLPFFGQSAGLTFAAAVLFGISSGMARERSESLLPCIILHWSCLTLLLVLPQYSLNLPLMLQELQRQLGRIL
jgi:membrane protease YdiL (CAAX protease family)